MCLHRAESGDFFGETKLLKFMRFLAPTSCALRYSRLPVSPWRSWWEQRYFGLLPFAVHLLLLVASLKARKGKPWVRKHACTHT